MVESRRVGSPPPHADDEVAKPLGAGASQDQAAGAARAGAFRIHARRNVQLVALVTHIEEGWQHHADVLNLGLGGAAIAIEARLQVADGVTLSFVAPTLWDPLVLRGRVVWARQEGAEMQAGVAFEHKSQSAVFALFELIGAMAYE